MIKDLSLFNGRIPQSIQIHLNSFLLNKPSKYLKKQGKYGAKSTYGDYKWYYEGELVAQLVDDELHILGKIEYTNRPKNLLMSYIIEYHTIACDSSDKIVFVDSFYKSYWRNIMIQFCG